MRNRSMPRISLSDLQPFVGGQLSVLLPTEETQFRAEIILIRRTVGSEIKEGDVCFTLRNAIELADGATQWRQATRKIGNREHEITSAFMYFGLIKSVINRGGTLQLGIPAAEQILTLYPKKHHGCLDLERLVQPKQQTA